LQSVEPTQNLLIVQTTGAQDPSDWQTVKQRIECTAPDIEVRIAINRQPNSATARWQVRRPSLVFSPDRLIGFAPRGGTVYCGYHYDKHEQVRRLKLIGAPVPRTEILSPGSSFDPEKWGDYVIVKPSLSGLGKGVKLVRTIDIPARFDELTAIASDRYLVQPYIDHSEDGYPTDYRVLSMFGRALYCVRSRWGNRRAPLAEIAADQHGVIASNDQRMGGHALAICNDPDVIALGERVHNAFPECPVLGVDIIREQPTGRLWLLEVNPHGNVWHLSSRISTTWPSMTPEHRRERYTQFSALDRAADLLIQKTRAEASMPLRRGGISAGSLPHKSIIQL
jgi:hypothetical protein